MIFPGITINQSSAVVSSGPIGTNHFFRKRFFEIDQQSFVEIQVTHRLKLVLGIEYRCFQKHLIYKKTYQKNSFDKSNIDFHLRPQYIKFIPNINLFF